MVPRGASALTRTQQLIAEIARQGSTRDSIAAVYRQGIMNQRWGDYVDWPTVNKALSKRYTVSGLKYIKTQVWKR